MKRFSTSKIMKFPKKQGAIKNFIKCEHHYLQNKYDENLDFSAFLELWFEPKIP